MSEQCDRCKSVGHDRRTLKMACFYAMDELPVPFRTTEVHVTVEHGTVPERLFTLRVCKRCRAEWMAAIESWFHAAPSGEDEDSDSIETLQKLRHDRGRMIEAQEELMRQWNALMALIRENQRQEYEITHRSSQ